MSRFFDELEAQLDQAARAQTDAGHSDARPPSRWRRLRSGARAIPVALAVGVTVAVVVAIGLTVHSARRPSTGASGSHATSSSAASHRPHAAGAVSTFATGGYATGQGTRIGSLGPSTPLQQQELKYVFAAQGKAMNTSACKAPPEPTTVSQGSPGPQLLSILGVLRRPATSADRLTIPDTSRPLYPVNAQTVYARYTRRARVQDGISYYIVPVEHIINPSIPSARCVAAQVAELHRMLPKIPAAQRASTRALQTRFLSMLKRSGAPSSQAAICIADFDAAMTGGSSCSPAAEIEQGTVLDGDNSTVFGVVPDGVATVTLHYRASKGTPALTETADIVGNLFVARAGRSVAGGGFPPEIVWHAADGKVLKTVRPPGG